MALLKDDLLPFGHKCCEAGEAFSCPVRACRERRENRSVSPHSLYLLRQCGLASGERVPDWLIERMVHINLGVFSGDSLMPGMRFVGRFIRLAVEDDHLLQNAQDGAVPSIAASFRS